MKFAVALVSAFDNDLRITIVEADDCVKGIIKGAKTLMPANEKMLDDMYTKAIDESDNMDSAIKLIQDDFFNFDCNIAVREV